MAFMNSWSHQHGLDYEIVIVDDGSTDRTVQIVQHYMMDQKETMTLLQLHSNCGKGAALKAGVQQARGSYILIVSTFLTLYNSTVHRIYSLACTCVHLSSMRTEQLGSRT